jgi:hypothetical protein
MDTIGNAATLKFNNISQPFGNVKTTTSGTTRYFYFNYAKIGQLTLFENNLTMIHGDTLVLQQTPDAPEFYANYFKRIRCRKGFPEFIKLAGFNCIFQRKRNSP